MPADEENHDTILAAPDPPARDEPRRLVAKTSLSAFEVGATIGEGGMGVVRSAVQLSLDRAVAIKTVRGGAEEGAEELVLREAWVTGYLEHPGVVPVHDIVKGEGGIPVVVMRKIDGSTWAHRMRDPDLAAAEGARDALEWNIRVLMRVAEIVEFAHSKGVLHRDIKPANVMLGAFGEIYLLDWGLAVATEEVALLHLPRAADVSGMGGTLAYAAPEMVRATDEPLGPASDVYLLGSVLYEIVTGRPPHLRTTTTLGLHSVVKNSPPPFDASFPPRLAALCTRAMQRSAAQRLADAGAFRRELVDFLRARDVDVLLGNAQRALGRLAEACAKHEPRARIYDVFGECRFAFREALRLAPDDAAAQRGLTVAASLIIELELARDPRVALALLEEWPSVDASLAGKVRRAAAREYEERAAMTRITRDHDSQLGRRPRLITFLVLGVGWSASMLLSDHWGPVTAHRFALGGAVQIPLVLAATAVFRDLRANLFNRRMMASIVAALLAQTILFLTGPLLGVALPAIRTLQIGVWAMVAGALGLLVDRRFAPMTLVLVAAFLTAIAAPDLRAIAASFGTLGVAANIAYVWGGNTRRYAGKERRKRPRRPS
ncbi:MAG: Serine/threonine-protein kinase PknB [Labilithrix sp.]|nr:Serine/threonine-protein kinase PknB [Labilithrix sp.]